MATSSWHLQQKKERLKREIGNNLDFLVGSVTSQGATGGFILTTKEKGKNKVQIHPGRYAQGCAKDDTPSSKA